MLVNLDNVISIEVYKETKTDYRWFEETIIDTRFLFIWGDRIVIPAGWGTVEATKHNVSYSGFGTFSQPERHLKEWLEATGHTFKDGSWYKKSQIYFRTNEGTLYERFESDIKLQEAIDQILSIKPNLLIL